MLTDLSSTRTISLRDHNTHQSRTSILLKAGPHLLSGRIRNHTYHPNSPSPRHPPTLRRTRAASPPYRSNRLLQKHPNLQRHRSLFFALPNLSKPSQRWSSRSDIQAHLQSLWSHLLGRVPFYKSAARLRHIHALLPRHRLQLPRPQLRLRPLKRHNSHPLFSRHPALFLPRHLLGRKLARRPQIPVHCHARRPQAQLPQ